MNALVYNSLTAPCDQPFSLLQNFAVNYQNGIFVYIYHI